MAYGVHDLQIVGITVKTILSLQISHVPGEHGKLELTADLGDSNMDFPIHETGSGQRITLFGKKDNRNDIIFSGIITNLSVESMGKNYHVKITAMTHSYLMDIKKKSRSFQDISMTYGDLIQQIVQEYANAECQILFNDMPLGEIAIQYEETDWQFVKRILSILNVPLVCSEVRENLCIYAGVSKIPEKICVISVETVYKDAEALEYWIENGKSVKDSDFITYGLKLDNHIALYSEVSYRGQELIVGRVDYITEGSTLYEIITLQKMNGIMQKTIYPTELVGTALEGTIIDVKGEKVQIHLRIDDEYQGYDCYWFPFSTPSASSDGSGWYCMPEKGDKVRIYFPSKRTGDVIAISAVSTYAPPQPAGAGRSNPPAGGHSGGSSDSGGDFSGVSSGGGSSFSGGGFGGSSSNSGGNLSGVGYGGAAGAVKDQASADAQAKKQDSKDKMGDPATKYLRTISGQEVKLSPKGIEVICCGNSAKIEILKSGRINLYSQNSILLRAKRNLTMQSNYMINMEAKDNLDMKSSMGGSLCLDKKGNIVIGGTEVYLN